jgi:UDP-N-acetylglucosamine acyltransferase
MTERSAHIHPTAIVADGAVIGEGTTVGAYSIIGSQVRLGRDNVVGPHVVLDGRTTLGDGNTIYQFASVGAPPQDLKYKGEPSELKIVNINRRSEPIYGKYSRWPRFSRRESLCCC